MITLKLLSGIIYQVIEINEYDITYNDLLKYIKKQKHPKYDEYDENNFIINNIVVKTTPQLFNYDNNNNINKICLDDEINFNDNIFVIFNYKIYVCYTYNFTDTHRLIELKNDEEIEKFHKKELNTHFALLCVIPNNFQTIELCKYAVINSGLNLKYVKHELMNDEICKLAIQQNCNAFKYVPLELMTDEICKFSYNK